ncbi:Synaptotagmin protein [Apis cerana cerana]|uniref:Synaptotagmin protein n=1 Tax=Apis cerana cerana TaxID=94128 RepID=A0A2A3EB21_APICC|nr:Synaptotagmin protein [Apis cerana cerana]
MQHMCQFSVQHLSPEASPLSTRSSRYSPRESESEPTPALPRKTGDSCSASQRIRDAITRTRRESNSSTRYESSGSESVRLSETGLHGYVELARKVKFFGGNGSGTVPLTIGSDEVVQRDSATSAGEDDPHDDNHGRTGPVSSQGRSMLRRRRQFDAQEVVPRCSKVVTDAVGIQTKRPITREDLLCRGIARRLVFISSDSSSGREEDDADSSCSSSSFLNGLPRAGSRTQSLEDCDWDYFESGSLPLPAGVPVAISTNNVGTETSAAQDWSCCPGRGSTACQACGGSRGANVLPVPVPIPVPVPYPVPVPASLWTSDFAAAASSMISRSGDAHSEPGTLRLDPRLTNLRQRMTNLHINRDENDDATKPINKDKLDESKKNRRGQRMFSRVFVVNDDSLTSDNDIEDNGDEDEDSDSVAEDGITLKRVTALPDEEPVVLQTRPSRKDDSLEMNDKSERDGNVNEKRRSRESQIELKSIKSLDPDSIEPVIFDNSTESVVERVETVTEENNLKIDGITSQDETESNNENNLDNQTQLSSTDTWDSNIIPDSLEVSAQEIVNDNEESTKFHASGIEDRINSEDNNNHFETMIGCDSFTSNETNTTGSEISSDELHDNEERTSCSTRWREQLLSQFEGTIDDRSRRVALEAKDGATEDDSEPKSDPNKIETTADKIQETLDAGEVGGGGGEGGSGGGGDGVEEGIEGYSPTTANNSNKYRSLVMITQEASYQPPDEVHQASQGLAGYFQLALEAVSEQPHRKNGQGPRKPLMVKRLASVTANHSETEVDSGLSVGSASESDDVSVKNSAKIGSKVESSEENSSDENSAGGGVVILEEGLADDDSWVEEAIDFTLHTIVEESCEESEAEPSLAAGSPSKKQRPPSASELEKYFFFGLGEGLESLGQDEAPGNGQSQERSNSGEGFLNSSRLEKYFLSEFLGFDQDRRDSDGSVGSDSEGRPSPEAQRRKKLNLSSQNSLQDLSLNQDAQETQSEGSSTETDGADDGQTAAFGTDGQFDTVKRKKKKPRNLGTQSPRVPDDRNKTPEPNREMVLVGEVVMENDAEAINSEDSERAKTPQPECILSSSSSPSGTVNASLTSTSLVDSSRNVQMSSGESLNYNQRSKQQSRDSGFVGSCDDLLQHQKLPEDGQPGSEISQESGKDRSNNETGENAQDANQISNEGTSGIEKGNVVKVDHHLSHTALPHLPNASLSRKDSFNNWSSDEETNLMMSKMRQFFKTMVANSNGQNQNTTNANSSAASPAPSPRLAGYASKARLCSQNRTKPPQLVYFENELTRLMKTVPGIRDEQVREIVEYLSSEDTWSDSYDSSDYTSSDLEGAAGGRRSALQEQISQSCQQIISKFDTTSGDNLLDKEREDKTVPTPGIQPPCLGRDTAFVYQKLVQSFTKMAGDGVSSDANSTPHSSPPLIAKVMHHIGSRLVALMHEVSEGGPSVQHHSTSWRRYSQHHRTPSSASTTEDDDSTSDSTNAPSSTHLQLPRSKSHDPLLLINSHPAASTGQEGEEREASDYERFSWRGSFESALMAADSRTKLSLLACSGDSVGASASANALAMAAKRRSAGDLLFNPKSFSREQLDRVRSCGSIGGGSGGAASAGSVEERIWSNRRRSSVPDANTRGESDTSTGDEDTEDELEYSGESRATTLPRGMQSAITAATNSLPRLPASTAPSGLTTTSTTPSTTMHKAHSVYHFLPQHSGVKSARYRPPGFARNSNVPGVLGGPKRAVSAPGLQVSGSQSSNGKRDNSRSRRQQTMSLTPDDGSSLSEACSTPIIGAGSRAGSSHTVIDVDDMDSGLHSGHLATRASLSSLGARSDSMASVYSGAGEGRCCRSVVVTGEVEFALQYDYKHLTFEVHVTKCKNLAPVDVKRKRSDPYVKVYLLPDKSKSGKRKTKVKKHTLNPEFNETLKFHMSLSGLETRTLWLTVWHSDMFGRNDFLGEVRMPLENKIFDDPTPKWYPLQERTEPFDDPVAYKGEVIVGLKFVPPDPTQQERDREAGSERSTSKSKKNMSRGALHVLVKEARNLQTRAKNSGTCDPFCKSYLLPDKGRSGKQKTGVVRRSGGSPVWGHTFIYKDVSLQELAERGLELTVWDHDRIASNEFLGGVRFNLGTGKHYGKPVDWMDATGRELSLWQSMLERPNFWVEGAVTLRPNLHNHGKNSNT